MKSITINTKVVDGKLKQNRNRITDAINAFEGKEITITLKRKMKQRSLPQNNFYFGVLIPLMYEGIKTEWQEIWNTEKIHEFLKNRFLYTEKINEETGEIVRIPKSTTENTTTEQMEYHLQIKEFLKEWFNIDAPDPHEELTLEF